MMKIFHWNSHSISSNRTDLLRLIDIHKFNTIALSETWLLPGSHFHSRGFNIFRDDREDGYGGTALLIRNHLDFIPLRINTYDLPVQMTAAKINNKTVVSIYILSDRIT